MSYFYYREQITNHYYQNDQNDQNDQSNQNNQNLETTEQYLRRINPSGSTYNPGYQSNSATHVVFIHGHQNIVIYGQSWPYNRPWH